MNTSGLAALFCYAVLWQTINQFVLIYRSTQTVCPDKPKRMYTVTIRTSLPMSHFCGSFMFQTLRCCLILQTSALSHLHSLFSCYLLLLHSVCILLFSIVGHVELDSNLVSFWPPEGSKNLQMHAVLYLFFLPSLSFCSTFFVFLHPLLPRISPPPNISLDLLGKKPNSHDLNLGYSRHQAGVTCKKAFSM